VTISVHRLWSVRATPLLATFAAVVLGGCGGGTEHRVAARATGLRTPAAVAACLLSDHIPATAYPRVAPGSPRVLLVMPWRAVQLAIYDKRVAPRMSVQDAGAVMASGNVALELDQLPEPPPQTMHAIEACAFGR
jgi:hypothetical protein